MRHLLVSLTTLALLPVSGSAVVAQGDEGSPPPAGAFDAAGSLSRARTGHTATLLPDGRVLITGGEGVDPEDLATAELWDPATATFGPVEELAEPRPEPLVEADITRTGHSATLLPDGRALVVGGAVDGAPTVEADILDLRSGTLGPAGTLAAARSGHTATFLRDGRVLVVGGTGTDGPLATAEVWTSASRPAKCLGKRPTLVAQPGTELVGSKGNDVIAGSVGDDIIRGGGGNDRICGYGGADTIDGGGGNDTIDAGPGADMVTGAGGDDRLTGAGGDDTLDGGKGNDVCNGGKGQDWLPGCNDKRGTKGTLTIRRNTTLKGPHRGNIVIDANDVTLDCAGHTVTSWRSGEGILLRRRNGVTVRNCGVTNFRIGVHLWESHGNTLENNRADRNRRIGFRLTRSNKNRLASNRADGNGLGNPDNTFGFFVTGHRNVLRANSADGNGEANFITVRPSSRNRLIDNVAVGGRFGFNAAGDRNTYEGNTVTESDWAFLAEDLDDSVIAGNTLVGPRQLFTLGGAGNTITGNAADGGYEDGSPPGANTYADNACSTDPSSSRPCSVRPTD